MKDIKYFLILFIAIGLLGFLFIYFLKSFNNVTLGNNEYIKSLSENINITDNNIMIDVKDGITYEELLNNLEINSDIFSFNDINDNLIVDNSLLIVTGSKLTLSNFIYPIIISGDSNGDGIITPLDYISIKKHLISEKIINNEILLLASDINHDNKISPLDYVIIRKILLQ